MLCIERINTTCSISAMDEWKSIVKARMKELGLSQAEMAERLGVTQGAIGHWLRGNRGAKVDVINDMLKAVGSPPLAITATDAQAMESNSNVEPALQPARAPKEYPLISWVIAGEWAESPDNFAPGDAEERLASTENAGEHGFWLTVRGDSMTCNGNPSFPEGSRILVRPESDRISGKYYVVKLLDSGETTFKQYIEDAGLKYLRPLNPSYRTMEINGNCRFVGRVIDTKMTGL